MKAKYAFTDFGQSTASALGRNLDISVKASINICNALRGMDSVKAINYLDDVIALKRPIPFTRFNDGVGHKAGMAAGRYPLKAAQAIRHLIKSAQNNAAAKGLADDLKIVHICAHKAATPLHQGRQRRRFMKRSHIEVVLKENEIKKAKKTEKKPAAINKSEAKKATPKKTTQTQKPVVKTEEKVEQAEKIEPKESKQPNEASK